jgi:hypothetical protein
MRVFAKTMAKNFDGMETWEFFSDGRRSSMMVAGGRVLRFDSKNRGSGVTTDASPRNNALTLCFCCRFRSVVTQGNGATEDCCSKCWREMMKKQGGVSDAAPVSAQKKKPLTPLAAESAAPEPMDVEPEAPSTTQPAAESAAVVVPAAAAATTTTTTTANPSSQSKKKKASYKNMMASMMKQQSAERDLEKEKEALRKVTGGGAFSKIDKI